MDGDTTKKFLDWLRDEEKAEISATLDLTLDTVARIQAILREKKYVWPRDDFPDLPASLVGVSYADSTNVVFPPPSVERSDNARERAVVELFRAAETIVRTWSRYPRNEHESHAMHRLRGAVDTMRELQELTQSEGTDNAERTDQPL